MFQDLSRRLIENRFLADLRRGSNLIYSDPDKDLKVTIGSFNGNL